MTRNKAERVLQELISKERNEVKSAKVIVTGSDDFRGNVCNSCGVPINSFGRCRCSD